MLKSYKLEKNFSDHLIPFPFEIRNISISIDLSDKLSSIPQISPAISKIHGAEGNIEYISLSEYNKKYLTYSCKEDFSYAYELAKFTIDPDLKKVAEGIINCNARFPNLTPTLNDHIVNKCLS